MSTAITLEVNTVRTWLFLSFLFKYTQLFSDNFFALHHNANHLL